MFLFLSIRQNGNISLVVKQVEVAKGSLQVNGKTMVIRSDEPDSPERNQGHWTTLCSF